MESALNVGNSLSISSRKAWVDRINFVCVWTKLDLCWHFNSTSEKVIESPGVTAIVWQFLSVCPVLSGKGRLIASMHSKASRKSGPAQWCSSVHMHSLCQSVYMARTDWLPHCALLVSGQCIQCKYVTEAFSLYSDRSQVPSLNSCTDSSTRTLFKCRVYYVASF